MALIDDLKTRTNDIFRAEFTTRQGRKVPEPKDVAQGNEAVGLDPATVLYADLTGSTALVDGYYWWFAAKIYKAYLYSAARIVNGEGGWITSYDGDRIMGVFIGDDQCNQAIRAALKINWAVHNIINPAIREKWPKSPYSVSQVVGIDKSIIRAANAGARGDNDIVWVGPAANHAAKLTERKFEQRTWITKAVYDAAGQTSRYGGTPSQSMWTSHENATIYGSTWWWQV